ncbi:MAG TPA: RnfABCDGE type electron transport complex subunit D [Blastocatellia bacterium]|nr:RnfABCDGE type electron transport complex subunit D [Blastocatellia bacterium]
MKPISPSIPAAIVQDAPARRRRFKYDSRFTAPILITCILLGGQLTFGFLESYSRTALAIAVSMAMELALGRIFTGRWPHLASAYITGISVGILVRSPEYWPYALCAALAITSKYVLRFRGRHIWNPSNFGICVVLFLADYAVASLSVQWGNYLWPMAVIWALGCLTVWRVKRFHICAAYVVSFLLFSVLRSWITGDVWAAEVAPLTGPMYQLFVFFMITDPKTTVNTRQGRMMVAFLVALVEMILRLDQVVWAPFYALFLVGPAALLVEMWWNSRSTSTGSAPTLAAR